MRRQRDELHRPVDDDPVLRVGRRLSQEPPAHAPREVGPEAFHPVGPASTAGGEADRRAVMYMCGPIW